MQRTLHMPDFWAMFSVLTTLIDYDALVLCKFPLHAEKLM